MKQMDQQPIIVSVKSGDKELCWKFQTMPDVALNLSSIGFALLGCSTFEEAVRHIKTKQEEYAGQFVASGI